MPQMKHALVYFVYNFRAAFATLPCDRIKVKNLWSILFANLYGSKKSCLGFDSSIESSIRRNKTRCSFSSQWFFLSGTPLVI